MDLKYFTCELCKTSVPYHFFEKVAPFAPQIKFNEPTYILADPESRVKLHHTRERMEKHGEKEPLLPIPMGGVCALCGVHVCESCSIYYCARFCVRCAHEHKEEFPEELKIK